MAAAGAVVNSSRYLSRPLEASVYWYQFTFAAAVVWGFALLPGGLTVALIGIVGSLGLRANAILCRPAAQRVFDSVPMSELPLNYRWVWLTFAKRIDADVTGVQIAVFGGGGLVYEFSSATQRLEYRDLYQPRKLPARIFGWSNHARG
jgi:hypothetical protein